MPNIQLKRIYEPAASSDGFRVLVDRLWPRGVSKERAHLDLWAKNISPSTALREAYHSGGYTFAEMQKIYRAELAKNPAVDDFVKTIAKKKTVTLLTATKDIGHAYVADIVHALKKKM